VRLQAIKRQLRSYARANQSLQRVARNVWGSARDMWITERLAVMLEMWHRYALFRRCKRYGQGIPVFPTVLANWTAFVDNYQARKLRQRMSTHYMPKVLPLPEPPLLSWSVIDLLSVLVRRTRCGDASVAGLVQSLSKSACGTSGELQSLGTVGVC
jgi:hypothetical protein